MKGKAEPVSDRFWRFVDIGPGCWLWEGSLEGNGYGRIHDRGKKRAAHRVAYELLYGDIPDGMWVLHTCDNRACVRPDHIYLGDRAQNMRDAHERGRIDLHRVASFPRPGKRK